MTIVPAHRMANPQTENGFVMVALDLFGAIMSAGLSTYAQVVLAEVLAQSYGPQKAKRVYLHGTEFNELTGIDRNSARKAITELVAAKILVADGGGYRFNKDYESWTPKMGRLEERIGGRLHGWISHLTERLGGRMHKRVREATQPQKDAPSEAIQPHETASSEATQPHWKPSREATQPHSHIEEHARPEIRDERDKKGEGRATPTPTVAPLRQAESPEAQRVLKIATERWGDKDGDRVVGDLLKEYDPAWVKVAIDKAWDKLGQDLRPPYIRSILQGFQRDGGPPKSVVSAAAASVKPKPEEVRTRIERPDLPRTPEFEAVHRMWDEHEARQASKTKDIAV